MDTMLAKYCVLLPETSRTRGVYMNHIDREISGEKIRGHLEIIRTFMEKINGVIIGRGIQNTATILIGWITLGGFSEPLLERARNS